MAVFRTGWAVTILTTAMPSIIAMAGDAAIAQSAPTLEQPLEILAVRVREQGHVCNTPLKAEHDAQASRPLEAVWLLICDNAGYRIVLHPDMAARVERLN